MANCKHDLPFLMGTAEGIRCRTCGKLFHSFEEIERDRAAADAPAPADKPKRPKRRAKADD